MLFLVYLWYFMFVKSIQFLNFYLSTTNVCYERATKFSCKNNESSTLWHVYYRIYRFVWSIYVNDVAGMSWSMTWVIYNHIYAIEYLLNVSSSKV